MFTVNNLSRRLEKLEAALLPKPEPPEIHFSYRVHTTQRLDDLRVTECPEAPEDANLVLDYVALRQDDGWRLSGEARRRRAAGPNDKGRIITAEGMQVGQVVREPGDGEIEMIVNADDTAWEEQPDVLWGGF